MRRSILCLGLSSLAFAFLAGCSGDDTNSPVTDAGSATDAGPDATTGSSDGGSDAAPSPSDAGQDAEPDAADAAIGPYLLLSYYYDGYSDTEYSAFDTVTGAVAGGLGYAQYGVNVSTNTSPWVLQQNNDLVLRMDPTQPWKPTSSWSLANVPQSAVSFGNEDPFAVVEVGNKAYVLGYASDYLAVLDTSQTYDAGAPTKTIGLVPNADAGAALEGIALAYDAAAGRIWVVLGNANSPSYPPICAPEDHPFVVAIDTTTGTLVSGVQYTLQGYGTPLATNAVAFDSANDRLLIATEGCNDPVDEPDGAVNPGAFDQAYIEQISLSGADAGADTILLTLSPSNSPAALVYVDETHAFVQTGNGPTYAWNPTQSTLGAVVSNAPDTFVWDGHGHLLGPKSTQLADDAGVSIAVVAVDPIDGGVTTLATNPFTPAPSNPFTQQAWQSVDLWPHP